MEVFSKKECRYQIWITAFKKIICLKPTGSLDTQQRCEPLLQKGSGLA